MPEKSYNSETVQDLRTSNFKLDEVVYIYVRVNLVVFRTFLMEVEIRKTAKKIACFPQNINIF